ncbi:MAG: DUF4149 domain-containing protein [Limisphaerales bacterium]
MISFVRIVALVNAAVWLGATALHGLSVAGAFSSSQMTALLGPLHAGAAGDVVAGRFHLLVWICLAVSAMAVLAEWLYTGRPPERWLAWLLCGVLVAHAADAWLVQPRAERLLRQAYLGPGRAVQRQAWTPAQISAANSLRWCRGTSRSLQAGSALVLGVYVWQAALALNATRFTPRVRMRI